MITCSLATLALIGSMVSSPMAQALADDVRATLNVGATVFLTITF